MKAKLLPILIANLFAVSGAAVAQDGGFKVTGSVGLGGIGTDFSSGTIDEAKAQEYRDLSNGALGVFDVRGRGDRFYLDAFGENIGRDDMYLDARGGMYNMWKGRIYGDWMRHNISWGTRLPYNGIGGDTLTAIAPFPAPAANPAAWPTFDYGFDRRNVGANAEVTLNSPFYLRADYNEVRFNDGVKVGAAAQGTSPGNGFVDLPFPVDYKTKNLSFEGGYQSSRGHFGVSWLQSKFSNNNEILNWQNGFFGNGLDKTTLPPDNDYTRWAANGVLRQLPLRSTLSGRFTYATLENSVGILGSMLGAGGAQLPANSSDGTYNGKVKNTTWAFSLASLPTRGLDTRLYWNYYKKDNTSTDVTFGVGPLDCGGVPCTTERYNYTKTNPGLEVGYRLNPSNRFSGGYDYFKTDRDRTDADETKDNKFYLQWANTSLDTLSARLKWEYLKRRSDFQNGSLGVNANDPLYLQRFVRAYDVADTDRNTIKLTLDWSPIRFLDVSFEGYYKKNDYKETTLGRTEDKRNEYYASISWGDPSKFRVMAFGDIEFINYDSYHRTINAGGCNVATGPNCFDPNSPPTAGAFNWSSENKDKNWLLGIGADWPVMPRLKIAASAMYGRSDGSADFSAQTLASGLPAATLTPINAYDNTKRTSLNIKGVYAVTKNWEVTGGYSYERYDYEDDQYTGFRNVVGAGATASYLSGVYAYPDYQANIFYGVVRYRFQ